MIASAGGEKATCSGKIVPGTCCVSDDRRSNEHAVIDPHELFFNGGRIFGENPERGLIMKDAVRLVEPRICGAPRAESIDPCAKT